MLAMLVPRGICEQFRILLSKFLELYGLLWCGTVAHLGPLMPIQMIQVTGFLSL